MILKNKYNNKINHIYIVKSGLFENKKQKFSKSRFYHKLIAVHCACTKYYLLYYG